MIDPEGGFLLVDKPLDWTSFQVVNKIKYLIKHNIGKKIKVGHAGTLDPKADGLLIVCYGKMTKKIVDFQGLPKVYEGTLVLGAVRPSFDLETEISETFPTDHIDMKSMIEVSSEMEGEQLQTPPAFSAKRIDGKRAYDLARKGEMKEPKPHLVIIQKFEILSQNGEEIEFRVNCSKGTYIRSLVSDFGKKLNSGAYLKRLKRTAIGEYELKDAVTIKELEDSLRTDD